MKTAKKIGTFSRLLCVSAIAFGIGSGLGGCSAVEAVFFTATDLSLEVTPKPTIAGAAPGAKAAIPQIVRVVDQMAARFKFEKGNAPSYLTTNSSITYLAYYSRRDVLFEVNWIYISVTSRTGSPSPNILITGSEGSSRTLNQLAKVLINELRQQVPGADWQVAKHTYRYGRF